jgi:hypothetical protein
MLHVVLATFCLRLACYALLPLCGSPWAVLPVELLHGITFACGWGAGTIHCKRVAPPGLEATMQVGEGRLPLPLLLLLLLLLLGPRTLACAAAALGWRRPAGRASCDAGLQGIFQGLYFGVGQGLGGVIGGVLKERYGSQQLFGMAAIIVLAGWATVVVAERMVARLSSRGAAASRYERMAD